MCSTLPGYRAWRKSCRWLSPRQRSMLPPMPPAWTRSWTPAKHASRTWVAWMRTRRAWWIGRAAPTWLSSAATWPGHYRSVLMIRLMMMMMMMMMLEGTMTMTVWQSLRTCVVSRRPQNRGCCPTLWAQLHGSWLMESRSCSRDVQPVRKSTERKGFTTYLVAWMRIQACKSVRPSTTAPSSTCLRLPGLVDWCRTIARFTMSWRKQPYNDFSPHWSASLQAKNWHRAKALTSTTRRACPMMAGFHFTGVMTS
ncbi:unnamed protein product [Symbiodinium sp. KB8]|nr:unnamed protein product [Symbiodinium sp. KB8]